VLFHAGDLAGYHSEAWWYPPSGIIAIALTNTAWQGRSVTETVLNHLVGVARARSHPLPASGGMPDDVGASGEFEYEKGEGLVVTSHNGGVTVTPVGQRTIDAVFTGDTSAWQVRDRAGKAAVSLIDRLIRSRVLDTLAGERLSPAKRADVQAEWDRLVRRGGRLKSYQILGTRRSGEASSATVILRLIFQRDSLLFGVGFSSDTLVFTQPGIENQLSPMKFVRTSADRWQAYDWIRDSVHVVSLRATGREPGTITLEMPNGSMVFRRTR
jgi:hypothetical protein